MLQKYRVFCPHCAASLLVTEDLLGTPGNCPGCRKDFQLPSLEEFSEEITAPPAPEQSAPTPLPPPLPQKPPAEFADSQSAVEDVEVPAEPLIPSPPVGRKWLRLRFLASIMKLASLLQIMAACGLLLVTIGMAVTNHPGPMPVLMSVGLALLLGLTSVPSFALSELLLAFAVREELLRQVVDELQQRNSDR